MTAREKATFDAGIRAAADMARIAALSLEVGDGARDLRHRAAAGALQAYAEALRSAFLDKPDPTRDVLAAIAADPAQSGETPCPQCAGRLRWVKDASNGHITAQCETGACVRVIQ